MNETSRNRIDRQHTPGRRFFSYGLRALGGLLGLILLFVLCVLLVLQTDWGREKAKYLAVNRVNALFDSVELRIERLDGTFIGRLALYNVDLVKTDGEHLVHLDTVTAAYRLLPLLPLLRNRLHLTDIYLARPLIRMTQQADSTWDLSRVIARVSAAIGTTKDPLVIELDQFNLKNGDVRAAFYTPGRNSVLRAQDINATVSAMRLGKTLTMRLDTLYARIAPPDSGADSILLALGGAIDGGHFTLHGLRLESSHSHVTGQGTFPLPAEENHQGRDLAFTLRAHPLAFRDLSLFVPALDPNGTAEIDVDLRGPTLGQVSGHANILLFDTGYGAYALDRTTLASTFTDGLGHIDLTTGLRGAAVTLSGTLRPFDATPSYDLGGLLANLDIGLLTGNARQHSPITARFHLQGRGIDLTTADLTATLALVPSRLNPYPIRGGRLTARLHGGDLDLDTRIDLPEGLIAARATAAFGDQVSYQVHSGQFRNLDVAALLGDSTRSALNGAFSLSGRGTDPAALTLQADLRLQPSFHGPYQLTSADLHADLRGGRLRLNGNADLAAGGALSLAATAQPFDAVPTFAVSRLAFSHVDLGMLGQNPAQHTDLNGTLTLNGRGADPAAMSLDARLDLTSSRLNEQPIEAAHLLAELRGGSLQFDARLDLPAGSTVLAGTARPFDAVPAYTLREGTFAGLNVGRLAGNPGLQTNLNGSLALAGAGLAPKTMTLGARLTFTHSTIDDATLLEGQVTADWKQGQAWLGADLKMDEGRVQVRATGNFLPEEPRYEAEGSVQTLNLDPLSGIDTLETRFSGGFDLRGEGLEPATMTLQGRLRACQGAYGRVRLDTLGAGFSMAAGVLSVDSLVMRSNVATATAGGQIVLFDTTGARSGVFRLDADIVSLEPLRPLVQADILLLRQGELHATVQGPPDRRRLEATAAVNGLVYNGLRLAGLEAHLTGELGPDRRLTRAELHAGLDYLSTLRTTVKRTSVDASYDGGEIALRGEAVIDERRDAQLAARLDPRPASRRLLIDSLNLRLDQDRWTLRAPATLSYGDAYRVADLQLLCGDQRISVNGIIDPRGEQDFHFAVEGLRMGAVADLFGFQGLDGTLSSAFDLTGPSPAPHLDGSLHFDILSYGQPAGALRLDLRYADRRMNLAALLTHREGRTLGIEGYLPLDLSLAPAGLQAAGNTNTDAAAGAVNLRLTADVFAIDWIRSFLDPETVSDLRGNLSTDIAITGALDAPALDGTFRLAEGRAGLPALGVTYRDIEVDAALAQGHIALNRVELHAGDGSLIATGRIEMPRLTLGQYTIHLVLDDFRAIHSAEYLATLSGDLRLSGTTEAPVVTGDLRVVSADIYLTSTAGGDIKQVDLTDEDVRMLEEFFGYRITRQDTTTSDIYAALTMDMNLEMERDIWIRQTANPEMAIQVTGQLELHKKPDEEILLFRSIEVIPTRSYIRQFGRRFDITRGKIAFDGAATEMVMDIGAKFDVRSRGNPGQPEAVITLSLSGRLDDLKFELGSQPQMSNTDIVSYIATGQPAGEALQFGGNGSSGDNGGLLTQGAALAANEVAGIVEGIAAEGLGLDVIEIQQDGLRGTEIVAGKYVSPRLYVGVNQPISLSRTESTPAGARPTEVTLEYEMFDWLLLRLLSGTSSSSVRLNLTGRYAFSGHAD